MAALVLSIAGGAAGALFGPVGAIAGRIAGALVGNVIDRNLLTPSRSLEGPRLSALDVMSSSEGAPIPRVYGRARISGQVIWATQLEEVVSQREEGGGKGGLGGGTSTTTYSYFANFAVGLCEGEIGGVARIWADGKLLDLSNIAFRVYRGDEMQDTDPLIAAKQAESGAPAYRGLAYVVFERLALENFGNRIPQLSFEVLRPVGKLERMVRAVTLIPGTTEFGYETASVTRTLGLGQSAPENRHVFDASSDVIAALDQLQAACPNLERVAIVVAWFGDDLRAGECRIRPCVDSAIKMTSGASWSVAGMTRAGADVVSQVEGRPAFGGTPSDESVRHLIAELKARGLKVTLYPFVMMDIPTDNAKPDPWSGAASQPAYPWRGRITCDPAPGQGGSPQGTPAAATQVDDFFAHGGDSGWNYRRMILHYAELAQAAGGVDAFIVGSELRALTRVRSGSGVYPAVDRLVTLAGDVKATLGGSTLVTYAADWTEYGCDVVAPDASEVRFPLDPLWACAAIDAVGIDYYAPLSDWRDEADHLDTAVADSIYDTSYLAANLRGGEAYDWYYADDAARAAQARSPITDGLGKPWLYRAKDIWAWWANAHYERTGGAELASPTAWTPQSKPIWLTELGCPAVDKGTNQPSTFPDPKSSESRLPHFSNGARDDLVQRRMLEAVLGAFDPAFGASDAFNPHSTEYDGRMIDASAVHLWTWDARPFPVFPAALDQWSDGANWQTGHWLTGRLGGAPLDALVTAMLDDSGVTIGDASRLRGTLDGYVVDRPMSPRAMIEPLAQVFAFDAAPVGDALRFLQRAGGVVAEFNEDDLVEPERGARAVLTRAQETELPREVSIGFTDGFRDYRRSAASSRRLVGGSNRTLQADYAIVTDDAAAARRAEILLQDLWAGRERAEFALGIDRLALTPGDVIAVEVSGRRRLFEIDDIAETEQRTIKARSIDPDVFAMSARTLPRMTAALPPAAAQVAAIALDLPCLDASEPPVLTRLAVFADPWPGSVTVWQTSDGESFTRLTTAVAPAIVGETLDDLPAGPVSRWDRAHAPRVRLLGGALSSASELRVLGGANAFAVRHESGAWEVLQFASAELVGEKTYLLSRLLRGQAGSEPAMASPLPAGSRVVLIDTHLVPVASGVDALERTLQLRLVGSSLGRDDPSALDLTVTPSAVALKPLAPVHPRATRAAGGVRLSWIRRTRHDGDGWGAEVPLGEDSEAYVLDVIDGPSVRRTLHVSSPEAFYTNADELADFGAAQSVLHIRVAQLSATVGRGFATEATFTL